MKTKISNKARTDPEIGLPILARVSGHAMSAARTTAQATNLRRRCLEDPGESRLLIQRHGSEHGALVVFTLQAFTAYIGREP